MSTGSTAAQLSSEGERRVTTLELFFDLVFVFTVTQLTVLLSHGFHATGFLRVVLVFTVLFWMYGGYAHLTNQVPPDSPRRRLLLMLAMCGFLMCALSVPTAFGAGGVPFGIGYLLVTVVHGLMYTEAHGRSVIWFAAPNVLCALSVLAAGFFDGGPAWALWVLALVFQFGTQLVVRFAGTPAEAEEETVSSQLGGMSAAHLVERHGLLLLIVFGESVIAIGIGVEGLPLTVGLFGGAFLALGIASALWWLYFVRDEGRAEEYLAAADGARRFKLSMLAYYYFFLPVLIGVATFAAGVKKTIGHLGEPLPAGPALALAGGVALYLAGDLAFRTVLRIGVLRYRAAALAGALATAAAGHRFNGAVQLGALLLVLVATLVAESRGVRRAEAAGVAGAAGGKAVAPEGA
ncbi:low temperature requirement protein A [Streptomyces sp. NPDC101132]|uniref:low temperature requirement protein A n=1 Tax=Streptomyces sp. NPDC101132 TaxID=3366110 RepID=UPI00382D1EDD